MSGENIRGPVRDVIEIIGGKWKLPILIALSFGNKRFGELEKAIEGITPKDNGKVINRFGK